MAKPSVARYLARLGYGTRRDAEALLLARRVTDADGRAVRDGDAVAHDALRVDGEPLDPPPGSVILLHKPLGYVCSTSDRPPLVYELLPARLLRRDPVMATVGRLDADTSGLLLLTDDGALNHRLTSPRSHVLKRYVVELADDLRGDEHTVFGSGTLRLAGDAEPLLPAAFEVLGARRAAIVVHEGRYHQVRRMFAAVGHHVVSLHRSHLGPLDLGPLVVGAWRVLQRSEVDALAAAAVRRRGGPLAATPQAADGSPGGA